MRLKVGCEAQTHQKPRTLAFRNFPAAKHDQLSSQNFHHSHPRSPPASNLTPPESSEDEHGQISCSEDPPSSPNDPHDDDMDLAEDAQPAVSPCLWEQGLDITTATPPRPVTIDVSLETPPRESYEAIHGGRVATPRWGHFRSTDMSMELCDVAEDDFPDGLMTSQPGWNHRALLRRRRLPSPIREDMGIVTSPPLTGVPAESLKWANSSGRIGTITEQTGMLTDSNINDKRRASTTGKTMLSMGYRADCEKCRTRVPGHYNHVIRT